MERLLLIWMVAVFITVSAIVAYVVRGLGLL